MADPSPTPRPRAILPWVVGVAAGVLAAVLVVAQFAGGHPARGDAATRRGANRSVHRVPLSPRAPDITTTTTTTAPTTTPTTAPAAPPYAIADESFTFVDPARPTPARGSVPATSGRVLRTVVRRPVGLSGPLPLVVFAPGYNSEPENYEPLLDAWAAAGFLVAAPECPGSAKDLPGTPVPDYAAQARDLSFVISNLLDGRAGPVDPNQIVEAGHSDGGTAVVIAALNPSFADARVKGYVVLAGQIPPDVPGPYGATSTPGVLLVAVGDDDQYGSLALSSAAYAAARMPKALLTVPGGDHLGTFVDNDPTAAAVRGATTRFLDLVFGSPGRVFAPAQLDQALVGAGGNPFSVSVGD